MFNDLNLSLIDWTSTVFSPLPLAIILSSSITHKIFCLINTSSELAGLNSANLYLNSSKIPAKIFLTQEIILRSFCLLNS